MCPTKHNLQTTTKEKCISTQSVSAVHSVASNLTIAAFKITHFTWFFVCLMIY